ncbi:MAG: hypothetical protein PF517_03870 [Salinivirgaceae bacterium]|jgi:hypothetical protein|nr:hypothetical protein [Salinivirgaceae bacterium]
MKIKQSVIIILWVAFSINSFAQSAIIAKWQKDEYQQSSNIPRLDYWYNNEEKMLYLVTNDNENLYIHFKALEKASQGKILNFGFTVWVDINGKNKKHKGIKFPIGKKEETPPSQNHENQRNGLNKQDDLLLNNDLEIELIGFSETDESEFIQAKNKGDIKGQLSFNEYNELQYMLTIPFNRIGIKNINDKIISLNMESGSPGINNPESRSADGVHGIGGNGVQGNGGGRQGGMQGGGGQSHMKQQGMEDRQSVRMPIKIKIKKIQLLNIN